VSFLSPDPSLRDDHEFPIIGNRYLQLMTSHQILISNNVVPVARSGRAGGSGAGAQEIRWVS